MAREEVNVQVNGSLIKNGALRLNNLNKQGYIYGNAKGVTSITIEWCTAAVTPAGTLTFSFNGDPGTAPGVINLGTGQRALHVSMPLPFVDVDVTGLPANAHVIAYLR